MCRDQKEGQYERERRWNEERARVFGGRYGEEEEEEEEEERERERERERKRDRDREQSDRAREREREREREKERERKEIEFKIEYRECLLIIFLCWFSYIYTLFNYINTSGCSRISAV